MINESTKSYSGNLNKAVYIDRLTVHSNIVFFDSRIGDIVYSTFKKSDNWIDFVTGCNVHNLVVVCNPNGSYTVE